MIHETKGQPRRIPTLIGPTAVGKTELSIILAKAGNGEIVSADSIQVYQRLNIGSAKPSREQQHGVPHHMLDIIPPERTGFSVAEYQSIAYAVFEDIFSQKRAPFVVGGTGLYITALESGMLFANTEQNPSFREEWRHREEREPGSAHKALSEKDPEAALRLHPNDNKRVIRALEILASTGLTLGEHQRRQAEAPKPYTLVKAGLTMPREQLYARIEKRVDAMMEEGLVEEVQGLLDSGISKFATALQGLGYKEIVAYLEGKTSLEESVDAIKLGTRHFAKRQWTWFRRDPGIGWFDLSEYEDRAELVADLQQYFAGAGIV